MEDMNMVQEDRVQDHCLQEEKETNFIDGLLYVGNIILGIWFVYLFYTKMVGISFLLFVVSFYLLFFIRLRQKLHFKSFFSWFLLLVIIVLSATYFIFSSTLFFILNIFVILFLIVSQNLLMIRLLNSSWDQLKFIQEIVFNFFERISTNFHRFFQHSFSNLMSFSGSKNINTMRKVLIGLLISIPLIFIVIALLAFADDVFKHYMNNLLQSLSLADLIKQIILFFLAGSILYGYLWSLMYCKNIENDDDTYQEARPPKSMDSVISMTFLVLFNLVYLGFFLVQFAYMFGAIHYVLPEGFSPADYARKGFSELLIIALINFAIYVIFIKFKPVAGKSYAFFINVCISLLVLFTLTILFSAHLRLTLYEAAFGYTYLRLLTHSFMIFLFALIMVALFKIWIHQVPLKKLYITISLIAFMVVNYMNIDKIIASKNIERYHEIGEIDEYYLHQLSFDSYPYLVEFYIFYESSPQLYRTFHRKYETLKKADHWVSFNISRRNAKKALDQFFQLEQLRIHPFGDEVQKMEF